jgi:hypothetical protein
MVFHYLFKPGAILTCLIALFFLAVTIQRGRQIPQCFRCGALKVRPSRPSGLLDLAGARFMIRSYRCSGCLVRFHAMRLFSRPVTGWVETRNRAPF